MSEISQTAGPAPVAAPPTITETPQSATVIVDQSPVYDGRLRELLSLVAVNLGLNIATSGFYRFWAKTRMRRFFLSRVSILNDRLVYTGTGMELFIGFLVVLGVLVPVLVGFELLKGYAFSQGMAVFVLSQGVYYSALMFLFFAAVYRAQRYRLSRITWRGIRGGQAGSALLYAIRAMAWSVAVLLTAGFAYPLMRNDLMAYRISNARFGQQSFQYGGTTTPLFFYWGLPWICLLVAAGCLIGLFGVAGTANVTEEWDSIPAEDRAMIGEMALKWSPVFFGALGLFLVANIWYRAAEVRHFTRNTTFENLSFESRFAGWKLFLPYLAYWTLMTLVFGGAMALVVVAMQQFDLAKVVSENEAMSMYVGLGVFILLLGAGSLLKPLILQNLLVRVFCNSLRIKGQIESDKLLQNQMNAPRRGEGLADALDIDGF